LTQFPIPAADFPPFAALKSAILNQRPDSCIDGDSSRKLQARGMVFRSSGIFRFHRLASFVFLNLRKILYDLEYSKTAVKVMTKFLKIISIPISLGTFGVLLWLENRRPLRSSVESKTIRNGRNLAVAGLAALALQIAEQPIVAPLTKLVERKKIGLLKIVRLPKFLETMLAVALLDYTLYLWHVLTHKLPFLWRFHLVHHIDLDMDASTAVRFHFAEMVISVAWRSAQILIIGVSPTSFAAWQLFLFPKIGSEV